MTGFLHIENLTRRFKGVVALDGMNLDIPRNSTTAFVGANGAGKTTTFSIVARYIKPHGGKVLVNGVTLAEYRSRGGTIGLLPQDVQFFENRSVIRQLVLFAGLSGLSRRSAKKEAERVLELVGLADRAKARVAELSRGMKVRLGTAQALLAKPELVMLDEPMAGLDPKMRKSFRDSIQEIRGETTLVISSHDLNELQLLCDYVCIIDQGRLVRSGPMAEMIEGQRDILYRVGHLTFQFDPLREQLPGVDFQIIEPDAFKATFDTEKIAVSEVNRIVLSWLLDHGVPVLGVDAEGSLESAYLDIVKGAKDS